MGSQEFGSGGGIRYGSRRSLRKKTDDDFHNEILPITLPSLPTNTAQNKPYLASTETLNASEKLSFYDDDKPITSSTNDISFLNEKSQSKTWSNDKLEHSPSRLSLQDVNKPSDDIRNSMGGGISVDGLYDNNNVALLSPATELSMVNNDITIVIPNMQRSVSEKRRNQHNFNAGTLRRNATLRNSNYFRNMRIHRNSIHYRGAMLNTHRYRLRASSCPNIYRNSMTTLAREDEEVDTSFFFIFISIKNLIQLHLLIIIIIFFFLLNAYRCGTIALLTSLNQYLIFHCF